MSLTTAMSDISQLILSTLCDHRGSLDVQSLERKLSPHCANPDTSLRKLLDDGKIAVRKGSQSPPVGRSFGSDTLIAAKTSLRLCRDRSNKCAGCNGLHLCWFLLNGSCSFGQKCKNPHDLSLPQNAELLRKHDLGCLTPKQLFQLLLQNDPFLLPEICQHYNKGNGEHGSCKYNTTCTKLHVCQHHFDGNCKFGSSCKRTHSVSGDGVKTFKGMSQEILDNLIEIYRNKSIVEGKPAVAPLEPKVRAPKPTDNKPRTPAVDAAKPVGDADRNEICLFFIRKHCSFQDKCVRVHWHLPYRWQVLDSDGATWRDLPNMEDIEKAYCEPSNKTSLANNDLTVLRSLTLSSSSTAKKLVDFKKMTCEGSRVRRLSTVSYASKPPHFLFTTKWLWYWQDESGQWMEYGQDYGDGKASLSSDTLENRFLDDSDAPIDFKAGKHQYTLHFKYAGGNPSFYQKNTKFHTEREVRRRPYFVSAEDVEKKLKSGASPSSSTSTADALPDHWDKDGLRDEGCKQVDLASKSLSQSEEYKMIQRLFARTLPYTKIHSIKRIQSPSLWRDFQWQKQKMKKKNGGKSVNEEYLFHGTDMSLVDAICVQNFDWRMCGAHGTAYGKGSYFAKDASYSNRYASTSLRRTKVMFVALVLVGDYAKGSSSLVRPPPRGPGNTLYDSCVDNVQDPSIYVIFERQQVYPAYLISYE